MSGEDTYFGYGRRIANNSTTTALSADASYTGTMEKVIEYNYIRLVIESDVDSNLNGIELQFNNDTTTSIFEKTIYDNYISPGIHTRDYPIKGRFFRLKYTNGSTAQSLLRIDTYFSKNELKDLKTDSESKIKSLSNNSNSMLGVDGVYTGTGEDVSRYKFIEIHMESDVVSASGGINVQFSSDNSTWSTNSAHGTLTYSTANSQLYQSFRVEKKFCRVVYTNSSTAQKRFKMNMILIPYVKKIDEPMEISYKQELLDGYSRIRISDVTTLGQFKHTQDKGIDTIKNEATSGTASSTHNPNESSVTLRVEAANSSIIRQSKRYITYQPGKSILIQLTGTLDAGKYLLSTPASGPNESDTISKIGYFDERNGYFFKYVPDGSGGGDMYIVERSYVSGTAVDNEIHQNHWNVDRLNGYDASGIVFDPTSSNIFVFDLQWLGVGGVRVGIMINNKIHYAHIFSHAGNRSTTYIGTATLPIRYELTSGSTGSNYNATMKEICGTVISEGGYIPTGLPRCAFLQDHADVASSLICTVDQTETPILAIRLKHANRRASVKITGYSGVCTTGGNIILRLRYYPNYSDDTSNQTPMTKSQAWQSVSDYSYVEFDINNIDTTSEMEMSTSDSYIVDIIYFSNNTDQTISDSLEEVFLTADIENSTATLTKRDVLLITGQRIGGTGSENVSASIHWSEFD